MSTKTLIKPSSKTSNTININKKYAVERNLTYDFTDESYSSIFPNLHKYPATMLPQIGVKILQEFSISEGILLDPYCGSGSSFASGLDFNFTQMIGFDLNPLAILISSTKFSFFSLDKLHKDYEFLKTHLYESAKDNFQSVILEIPECKNIDFWFSKDIQTRLAVINYFINQIVDNNFFKVAFSETIRECSFTRNNEFKLYKMKESDILKFNPDVFKMFLKKCERNINIYSDVYLPKLKNQKIYIYHQPLNSGEIPPVDVVLTSPPYGDSKTTVAYGQFSNFSNEWLGYKEARAVDKLLMGGQNNTHLYTNGYISTYIAQIEQVCLKRALEISAFYFDLATSIKEVGKAVKVNGYSIYIVGNRTVKQITLPTDQFIAEQFELNGFIHMKTYKRLISNKVMPKRNSPTNEKGKTVKTMNYEYIVICRKNHEI